MLRKALLSVASLLVAVVAAEGVVRLAGAAPEVSVIRRGRFQLSANPRLGYEPAPLVYHGDQRAFFDYEGASNRLGYRDVDHAVEKVPGTFRIVVLGDSVAAGLQVEDFADTFPPRLQELLRARGVPAEVINLGVSGYNTRQEVETLRVRGLDYDPDLVLLAYTLNDRERVDGDILTTLLAARGAAQRVSEARHPLLVRSALYRLLRYRVARRAEAPADLQARYAELLSGDTVEPSLRDLAVLSREHGFAVLLAVFPRIANYRRYRFGDHHEWVMARCAENGFACLDLLAAFSACQSAAPDVALGADAFHPTAAGHRCAAEALADAIATRAVATGA